MPLLRSYDPFGVSLRATFVRTPCGVRNFNPSGIEIQRTKGTHVPISIPEGVLIGNSEGVLTKVARSGTPKGS
jgi:hypothetical protein